MPNHGQAGLRRKISRRDMRAALLRSGYPLERRIESLLAARGYLVEASSAYPDEFSGKSRELDLWALNAKKAGPGGVGGPDLVWPVVLCECENNAQPVVFFMSELETPFLHHMEVKVSGLPVKVLHVGENQETDSEAYVLLPEFLNMDKYHHYCVERDSTQYCTFQCKRGQEPEWMALHDERHHDALNALIAVLETAIADHYESWELANDEPVNIQVYYPTLVLQGVLYEADVRGSKLDLRPAQHIVFRKEYHSAKRKGTYRIDVVTESYFADFLDTIEAEADKMARLLRRRHKIVRASIDAIVSRARAAGEDASIQELFEP